MYVKKCIRNTVNSVSCLRAEDLYFRIVRFMTSLNEAFGSGRGFFIAAGLLALWMMSSFLCCYSNIQLLAHASLLANAADAREHRASHGGGARLSKRGEGA